jgi:hypothetical protein
MWRAAVLVLVLGLPALLPQRPTSAQDAGVVTATVTVAGVGTIELVIPDRKVRAGNPFQLEARIYVQQQQTGRVTLHHPEALLLRTDGSTPVLVQPEKATVVRWSACSETAGQHVLMASFEGAALLIESNAEVRDRGKQKATCAQPWR